MLLFAGDGKAFGDAFITDPFARFMKVLTLIGSVVTLIMSVGFAKAEKFDKFEYPVLILLATLGMMLMISANDMIALYLGLELQSLALYVVAAINRDSLRSTEAGLKYFVLGALSSGMLLYGISLVYGYTGNTGFDEIAAALGGGERQLGLVFGLVFVLAGLAFKISAVPFHMWTPDVYEGAPTPVTAFFAAAPKMAAMALLVRVTMGAFEPIAPDWQQIIVFISIASMVLGSFAAIGQTNIKRLMAYSSIGHMGFALVGLAANSQAGVRGVVIYMLIYLVMTLGTFAFILAMRRKDGNVEQISDLAGLSATNPVMATILTILMFSLAGIPPLAGFWAKWYVFLAAIDAELYALAVIGVLASVVGAYYYLRIIKIMWFDEPVGGFLPMAGELRLVLGALRRLRAVLRARSAGRSARHGRSRRQDILLTGWRFLLAPTRRREGYRLEAHDTVGSTNALALERARAGDPGKLWIVSKQQESGRGRRGRAWATPQGNLAATLLLVTDCDLALAATLGFVAGLALADALDAVVPDGRIAIAPDGGSGAGRNRFELKWPNDVLADGAKLAGILLESAMLAERPHRGGGRHRRQCRGVSRGRALSRDIAEGAGRGMRCRDAVSRAVGRLERDMRASGTRGGG